MHLLSYLPEFGSTGDLGNEKLRFKLCTSQSSAPHSPVWENIPCKHMRAHTLTHTHTYTPRPLISDLGAAEVSLIYDEGLLHPSRDSGALAYFLLFHLHLFSLQIRETSLCRQPASRAGGAEFSWGPNSHWK